MKIAAILVVLIVGSNAGLVDPVTNLLSSIQASVKSSSLLKSLTDQIDGVETEATNGIKSEWNDVLVAILDALNVYPPDVQDIVDEKLYDLIQGLIAAENLGLIVQPISETLGYVKNQINAKVNQQIAILVDRIKAGVIRVQCFNEEIPQIQADIAVVVIEVEAALLTEVTKITAKADQLVAGLSNDIVVLKNCANAADCQILERLPGIANSTITDFQKVVNDSAADLAVAGQGIVSSVQTKLSKIASDITACTKLF